ncbi:ectoine/hydroxyectoine ABC transporter substrate-binding protein EhuB [Hydrogenophaga crassostreae]|uniref:Ectoine/hydroxyectoine ABC transporter substrate-binding protein EhuB n=1 Tax=Hydrogenophaga crassostreae TaxID=1763535 RepID=A0A167I4H5_9BURK|nr:ectoine/hydroxyectoine ABC transporter substrate-binding protein EhuB [Hydrogenophaga crassostreae]AOW14140.1 ectoine/hydroxyectoine ABC transporter substrate-binding protein EhuB [Hydrogenophaga crassostreae]OAD42137.1 ectoine/hydroxyectoine ABC transporter substrate-binding protein EhuB [Hydrogenophaga crassostreae]
MKRNSFTRRALIALAGAATLATSSLAAAETTLERVQKQGYIRVGFANEAPYAFATPDGKLNGESPSVFRHVMANLGVKEVDGVLTEWGALIPGLKAGRFDAIVASMYITPKRCEQIIFANPTYGIGEALVVKKGNPDGVNTYGDVVKKGLKIAFVAGTAEIEHGRLAGLKRDQEVTVPNFAAAVASVKSGRAAAAAFTSLTAKDLAGKDDGIERAEPFTFEHKGKKYKGEGSFGFRQEDTSLRDAVNAELAKFLGTPEHLKMVSEFGFDASNMPEKTAAQHCAGE